MQFENVSYLASFGEILFLEPSEIHMYMYP